MDDAVRIRDDEFAEMELRVLVALYDAWPNAQTIRLGEVYRPGARYTGPNDAPAVMTGLLAAGRVRGQLGAVGLTAGRLETETYWRLDAVDGGGTPWIAKLRGVIAEACRPVMGRAVAVRDGLWG